MSEREAQRVQGAQTTTAASTARTSDVTARDLEELSKLADLKAHGDISEAEYEHAKERLLH